MIGPRRLGSVLFWVGTLVGVLALGTGCPSGDPNSSADSMARNGPPPTPETIAERVVQADAFLAKRDAQAAIDLLRPLVSREQVDARILDRYGRALYSNGQPSLAIWPLARAADGADPKSEVVWFYAQALLFGGEPAGALAELNRLIELEPNQPRLIRLRAKAFQRQLAYEDALEDMERLIDLVPEELGALEARIDLLTKLDLVDEARESLAELGRRLADSGLSDEAMGRFCASSALFEHKHDASDLARSMLKGCLEKYPGEPDVILPWIIFLDDVDGDEAGTKALEAAVRGRGRGKLRLWLALAARYAKDGRRAETASLLNKAVVDLETPQPLFALADHRVEWGDFEGAREAVDRAITMRLGKAPGSPGFSWAELPVQGRFAFGDILIQAGELERAEGLIASLEDDKEAEAVYPLLLRARLELERGNPEEALALFEESFKFWPSNPAARNLAGRAAMQLGELDRGMVFYQDAFRAEPTNSDAALILARMQSAQGLFGAAANSLSSLLGQTNEDPFVLRLFANLASRAGAVETAEDARKDLARRLGWVDLAMRDQAADLMGREGVRAAIDYLEGQPEFENPRNHESRILWSQLMGQLGESEQQEAWDAIRSLRSASPPSAEMEILWARVSREQGNPEQAIAAYEKAIELDPRQTRAGIELGVLQLEAGSFEAAESSFANVLRFEPNDVEASLGHADAALQAGRSEEARERYRKILHFHPWHGRSAEQLARIAFESGDSSDETLTYARWGARFNDGDAEEAALLLAEVRMARSEFRQALPPLAVAIETAATPSARAHFLLGAAQAELGDSQTAIETLEQALEIGPFPESENARALLAELRSGEAR